MQILTEYLRKMTLTFALFLIPLIDRTSSAKYRKIESCPSSIVQWKRRESMFTCTLERPYHCILLHNTSQLIEACVASVTIGPGEEGCPWILIYKGAPIHGSKHSLCPVDNPECPPSNHKGYLSNQLYQYPACFLPRTKRKSPMPETTTNRNLNAVIFQTTAAPQTSEDQSHVTIIPVIVTIIILVLAVAVVWKLRRRGINEEIRVDNVPSANNEEKKEKHDTNEEQAFFPKSDRDIDVEFGSDTLVKPCKDSIDIEEGRPMIPNKQDIGERLCSGTQKDQSGKNVLLRTTESSELIETDDKQGDPAFISKRVTDEADDDDDSTEENMNHETSSEEENGHISQKGIINEIIREIFHYILQCQNGIAKFDNILLYDTLNAVTPIDTDPGHFLKENNRLFRLITKGEEIVYVVPCCQEARLCDKYHTSMKCDGNCMAFHVCRSFIKRTCTYSDCTLQHSFDNEHNLAVKSELGLDFLSDLEMQRIIRNRYPQVCSLPECARDDCPFIHLRTEETLSKNKHPLHSPRNRTILRAYDIKAREMSNLENLKNKFSTAVKCNETLS